MTTKDENMKPETAPDAAPEKKPEKTPEPQERPRRIVRSASTKAKPAQGDGPSDAAGGESPSGGAGEAAKAAETPAQSSSEAAPSEKAAAPAKVSEPGAGGGAVHARPPWKGGGGGGGGDRARSGGPGGGPRPSGPRPGGPRPEGARPEGGRPPRGPRPSYASRADEMRPRPPGSPRFGSATPEGSRPEGARPEGGRPEGGRPEGGRRFGPGGGGRPGGRPRFNDGGAEGGRPRGPRPGAPEGARSEGGPRPEAKPRSEGAPDASAKPAAPSAPAAAKPAAAKPAAPKPQAPPAAPAKAPPKPAAPVPVGVWSPKVAETLGKNAKPAMTAKEAMAAKAKAAQMAAAAQKSKAAEAAREASAAAPAAISAELIGVDWEGAAPAIRSVGEAGAQALVDAWFGATNAAAIAAVAEADDVPGSAKKAAKRALGILKSRGVAVPTKPHVVRFTEREESIEATFLPPDLSGTLSLSITTRDTSGRYRIAEVIVREPAGIIHAGSAWLSGSQLKEGRARALENVGVAPAPVPVEWARYRIAQARQMNAASRQVLPLGLERCRDLIEPTPEAEPPHPIADLESSITSEVAATRVASSMSLHEEPEFRSWMPDRASLDALLQGVGKRLGADGLRDSALVNAALEEEIALATDRFFSPEIRSLIARRMRDGAISVRSRKGDRRASDVLAIARAIQEAGLITAPPREIPFLIGFFQKGIGALAHQGGGSLRIPVAPPQAAPAGSSEGASTSTTDEASAPQASAE